MSTRPLYETIVRKYGSKRIPMPQVIEHVLGLHQQGAQLFCWSSGGADYARASAKEFGIEHCFVGFLPKPEVLLDDCCFDQWRYLLQVHPNECHGHSVESYRHAIKSGKKTESTANDSTML